MSSNTFTTTPSGRPGHKGSPSTADDDDGGAVPAWHRMGAAAVIEHLESSVDGLTTDEASTRLARDGRNELVDRGSTHPLRIVWGQISAVMVLILIGAALLSLALAKYLEAGAIGAIVVLFTALGFLQEYRAEQAIAALRRMSVPTVRVRRDGRQAEVASVELVAGDVISLEAGSIVPADLRLVETANLRVLESALTGESEPVDKRVEPVDSDDVALGDRSCMAYSGTQVSYGRATGVVVATGMATELGRIASLLQGVGHDQTPLQERLDRVGKQLALIGLVVAAIVVVMGALAGEAFSDLVLTAISVAVAVIPEGLPAVVTFTLAIGAQRMLRRNSLIRRLPAVETLGSVTVICSDKTGTLTQNVMTVTRIETIGEHLVVDQHAPEWDVARLGSGVVITLATAVLCNDGHLDLAAEGEPGSMGDPTETALLHAAHEAGVDVAGLRTTMARRSEIPFDSERKRMSTVHDPLGGRVPMLAALPQDEALAFVKGAVDGLLEHTTHLWEGDRRVAMSDDHRRRVSSVNDELASGGMRVLGMAYRTLPAVDADGVESDLTLVGLVGMIDPPRPEVRDAVATCEGAGIRAVMITGDHPLTAQAIAADLGIGDGDRVLTGAELSHLDDDELDVAVREVSVFARVSPEHKLRIVGALQAQGEVVAMTGDGVNDAPALKRADLGVAMGITGTDVSKEAADMVLRDDNFATIVAAVEEGRVIYDNLRRFVSFAVAGNLGKIIVMLGWPVPYLISGGDVDALALLPLQLLWLNLMTDGLLGLSIGMEPAERGVMLRAPHTPGASLWAGGLGRRTAWVGAMIGAAALGVGFAYNEAGRPEWQTMMFTSLALMQVFQALATRSHVDGLRATGVASNPLMTVIAAVVIGLQLAAIYTPLRGFLDLEPLGVGDLAICFGLGIGVLVVIDSVKAVTRRRARPAQVGLAGEG
ncbi:MAG: cation-translocating P-type ATPase [Acidimicrobiales bacterium]